MKIILRYKGGSGSGNFNHEGIPGHLGGSSSSGGKLPDGADYDYGRERKSILSKSPAISDDAISIKAAKIVAKKYKIKYQDILKNHRPTMNISGASAWDKDGNIVSQERAMRLW